MVRTGPSAADQQLISQLAARDLSVSATQLERWRHAGLLPRNSRHGSGRGRGSVSEASPEAVEIAAALSRHTRQGRDLRLAVIDWFAEAGRNAPGSVPAPEPPDAAVHKAVIWVIATSLGYQLLRLARSARTDSQQDDFYRAAGDALRGESPQPAFDAAAMRNALLTGDDPSSSLLPAAANARGSLIHLIAATEMGIGE